MIKAYLPQILLGTCPILGFVAPCVLTGAFYLRSEPIYVSLGNLMFVLATICNVFFLTSAVYCIQEVLDQHHALLHMPLPKFRELDYIDWKNGKVGVLVKSITLWSNLGGFTKVIATLAWFTMTISVWLFQAFDSLCFEPYSLQTDKEEVTPVTKVIKPIGWWALGLFTLSCILFYIFMKVLGGKCKEPVKELKKEFLDPEIRVQWEAKLEKVIVKLELELKQHHPGDYEVYLVQAQKEDPHEGSSANTYTVTTEMMVSEESIQNGDFRVAGDETDHDQKKDGLNDLSVLALVRARKAGKRFAGLLKSRQIKVTRVSKFARDQTQLAEQGDFDIKVFEEYLLNEMSEHSAIKALSNSGLRLHRGDVQHFRDRMQDAIEIAILDAVMEAQAIEKKYDGAAANVDLSEVLSTVQLLETAAEEHARYAARVAAGHDKGMSPDEVDLGIEAEKTVNHPSRMTNEEANKTENLSSLDISMMDHRDGHNATTFDSRAQMQERKAAAAGTKHTV